MQHILTLGIIVKKEYCLVCSNTQLVLPAFRNSYLTAEALKASKSQNQGTGYKK
jgi:hypothetical protein